MVAEWEKHYRFLNSNPNAVNKQELLRQVFEVDNINEKGPEGPVRWRPENFYRTQLLDFLTFIRLLKTA